MDKLYAEYEDSSLSASVKKKLADGKNMAYLSRTLAKIDSEAPIDITLDECSYQGPDKENLYALFAELEFFALIKKFGLEGVQMPAKKNNTEAEICECENVCEISAKDARERFRGKRVAVALKDGAISVFDGESRASLGFDEDLTFLSECEIICHDYKSLYKTLVSNGITPPKCSFDTMLAAYVLNSGRNKYSFEEVLTAYLGTADTAEGEDVAVYKLLIRLLHR